MGRGTAARSDQTRSKQAGTQQVAQAANIIRDTSRSRLRAQPLCSREREEKLHKLATRDCGTLERPGTCSEVSCWKLHVQYIICDRLQYLTCTSYVTLDYMYIISDGDDDDDDDRKGHQCKAKRRRQQCYHFA